MAQMGRPPKPVERKRATGNPGKRKLPDQNKVIELLPAHRMPEPHRPLSKYGTELWDSVWRMGQTWISPTTDAEILLMTCEMVDERWNLRIAVLRDGRPDERKALRQLDRAIVENLSLLGFTPTDRTRLGVAEIKRVSKLQELKDRAAQEA